MTQSDLHFKRGSQAVVQRIDSKRQRVVTGRPARRSVHGPSWEAEAQTCSWGGKEGWDHRYILMTRFPNNWIWGLKEGEGSRMTPRILAWVTFGWGQRGRRVVGGGEVGGRLDGGGESMKQELCVWHFLFQMLIKSSSGNCKSHPLYVLSWKIKAL